MGLFDGFERVRNPDRDRVKGRISDINIWFVCISIKIQPPFQCEIRGVMFEDATQWNDGSTTWNPRVPKTF
jgi:hypothetical protein